MKWQKLESTSDTNVNNLYTWQTNTVLFKRFFVDCVSKKKAIENKIIIDDFYRYTKIALTPPPLKDL